jgi:PAS domain S-box-containing protein
MLQPSLRLRLILLAFAAMAPVMAFGLVEVYRHYLDDVERTGAEKTRLARGIAIAVDSEVKRHLAAVLVLARSKRLADGDMTGFRAQAEEVVTDQFPGSAILLQDLDGTQLMNTSAPAGARFPPREDLDSLRQAVATGRPTVSNVFFGRVVNRHTFAIDVPVKDASGTVVRVLSIEPPVEVFADVVEGLRPPGNWVVTVFDRHGVIAARSSNPRLHVGQEAGPYLLQRLLTEKDGTFRSTSRENVSVIGAFVHSDIFGWAVIIAVPESELWAPVRASLVEGMLGGALCIGLALAMASFVASGISTPIRRLRSIVAGPGSEASTIDLRTGLGDSDAVAEAWSAEQARRSVSERRYRALFDANPHLVAVYDLQTMRFLEVNEAAIRHYGWSRDEFLSMTVADVCVPEERARLAAMHTARHREAYSLRHWRKDGTRFDVEAVTCIIEFDGRRAALAMSHDVTDQNLTRSRLAEAIQAFPGSFRLYDVNERLVLMNEERWSSLGLGVNIGDTMEKAARAVAQIGADAAAIGREEAWIVERLAQFRRANADVEVRTRDGRWHHLIERRTADGGTISLRMDITERKRIEEQLRQAQKMETFGQLAGGIAHDFNNSLAVVTMSLENVLDIEGVDEEARASAQTALHAADQASSMTKRLLAFARRQELAPTELDVGAVVRDLEKILRFTVSRLIDVTVQTAADCRSVLDRTELETAVMNMVINSRDAIIGTGQIHISVEKRTVTDQNVTEKPRLKVGAWVVVSVSDSGGGIPPELIERVFEPFFTTKEVGKGTGLGLSQIHGFVSQSGGFITVDSTVGTGTRIELHFPSR